MRGTQVHALTKLDQDLQICCCHNEPVHVVSKLCSSWQLEHRQVLLSQAGELEQQA